MTKLSQHNNNNDTENNEKDDRKLFFTTSDLLSRLNKNLNDMESPTDVLQPKFELQRKLPDGSTRKATDSDVKVADMQTKLKQAADSISNLSPKERINWAERMKQEGNKLYQKCQYQEAMDVYLTCFVAKPTPTTSSEPVMGEGQDKGTSDIGIAGNDDEEKILSRKFTEEVLLPVLNNLAQCALQLGMYKKAEQFCTITLEEINKDATSIFHNGAENINAKEAGEKQTTLLAKIYYRRGKARRCRGAYNSSRIDLAKAMDLLSSTSSNTNDVITINLNDSSTDLSSSPAPKHEELIRTIERELKKVDVAENEGRKNKKRQERAMQEVLGGAGHANSAAKSGIGAIVQNEVDDNEMTSQNGEKSKSPSSTEEEEDILGLYNDVLRHRRRNYSTLRAPSKDFLNNNDLTFDDDSFYDPDDYSDDISISCWQYYLLVVAKLAEKALKVLGDEETIQKEQRRRER